MSGLKKNSLKCVPGHGKGDQTRDDVYRKDLGLRNTRV
jgi:hypothetical protein